MALPLAGSIESKRKMVWPLFVAGVWGTVHLLVKEEMGELPVLNQDAYAIQPVCRGSTADEAGLVGVAIRPGVLPSFWAMWMTRPSASIR